LKKRFFFFSISASVSSLLLLLFILSPLWQNFKWWQLTLYYLLPVVLVSILLHVIFLFYFWDPYERSLYKQLKIDQDSFHMDIIHNIEQAWKNIRDQNKLIEHEKNKLQHIISYMSEGVMICNQEGKIIQCNPAMEALLNFPPLLIGKYYWEVIIHPELCSKIKSTLETQDPSHGEVVFMSPAEKNVRFELIALHIQDDPQLLIKLSDWTQIRKLERIRADFVANVSHELRSPLTAILGFVETLHEEKTLSHEKREKFLSIIHQNVLRLSDIVNDLLVLSRVESGEQADYTKFNPGDLMSEVIDLYRQKIQEKDHSIHVKLQDSSREILADRYHLRQIFINLLDNAIKYTPDHGVIILTQRFEDSCYIVNVEDSGLGIPYNDQSRIFERFYRVDKSRTGETSGTGLGLSIVKNIVESHHGSISVKSELGKGSCFTVVLPIENEIA
jgi:two-component system, OmpR family, phosphate regulon sensor histidine kinase PhoR